MRRVLVPPVSCGKPRLAADMRMAPDPGKPRSGAISLAVREGGLELTSTPTLYESASGVQPQKMNDLRIVTYGWLHRDTPSYRLLSTFSSTFG